MYARHNKAVGGPASCLLWWRQSGSGPCGALVRMKGEIHGAESCSGAEEPRGDEATKGRFVLSLVLTGLILVAEIVGGLWTGKPGPPFRRRACVPGHAGPRNELCGHRARESQAERQAHLRISPVEGARRLRQRSHAALGRRGDLSAKQYTALRIPRPSWPARCSWSPLIGLVVNLVVALLLRSHDHDDLNTQSAFLHVLSDALSSVGVIGAGTLILFTGWMWVDPLVSVLIACGHPVGFRTGAEAGGSHPQRRSSGRCGSSPTSRQRWAAWPG